MSPAPAGRLHRAVGIETEYGVTSAHVAAGLDGAPLSVEEAVQEVFRDVSSPPSGTHRFTTSGARLYIDIGMHPEYAGPECVWATDAVAQDLAGDAVLASMTRAANARLESRGVRIHLLKSNTDAWGSTFGCHENYQVTRDAPLPLGGMVGLLAARQILAGTGSLACGRGGQADAGSRTDDGGTGAPDTPGPPLDHPLGPMLYSARADHIHGAASADPTHERAFVNTRDEPHADASRWRRLHVVAGDSAVSPWTTAIKIVVMDAALTLVERGEWDMAECELADPARAVHAWNREPNAACERVGGRSSITCPELLELALERLTGRLSSKTDALTASVLDLAERGARALRSGCPQLVATELDWAIKHRVLARVAERAASGWRDPRVRRAELAYHDLSADSGLRGALTSAGLMKPLVSPQEVEAARIGPPCGTRAGLRGRVVAACERTGRVASIGWAHVRLDNPPRPQIDLPDPTQTEDADVEALLAEIDALGPA